MSSLWQDGDYEKISEDPNDTHLHTAPSKKIAKSSSKHCQQKFREAWLKDENYI